MKSTASKSLRNNRSGSAGNLVDLASLKTGNLSPLSEDALGAVLLFLPIKDIVVTLPCVNQKLYLVSTSDNLWDFLYHRDVPALYRAVVAQNILLCTKTELSPPNFIPRRFVGWDEDVDEEDDSTSNDDDDDDLDATGSLNDDQDKKPLLLPNKAPDDHMARGPKQFKLSHRGTRLIYFKAMTGCPAGYGGGGVICNVCAKGVNLNTEAFYHRRWFQGMMSPQFDVCMKCVHKAVARKQSRGTPDGKVGQVMAGLSQTMEDAQAAIGPEGATTGIAPPAGDDGAAPKLAPGQVVAIEFDEVYDDATKGSTKTVDGDETTTTVGSIDPLMTKREFFTVAKNLHMYQPFLRFRRPKNRYAADPETQEMEIRKSVEGLGDHEELPPELKADVIAKHLDLKDLYSSIAVAEELEGHLEEDEHLAIIHTGNFWHRQYMEALKTNGVHDDLERAVDAFDLYGVGGALKELSWPQRLTSDLWWGNYMNKLLFFNADKAPLNALEAKTFFKIFGQAETSADIFFARCVMAASEEEQQDLRQEARALRDKVPAGGKALTEDEIRAKKEAEGKQFLPTELKDAVAYIQPSAVVMRERTVFNEDAIDAKAETIGQELRRIHTFIPSLPKLYSSYCFYRNKLAPVMVQDYARRSLLASFCMGWVALFHKSYSGYGGWIVYWCTSRYARGADGSRELRTEFERRAVLMEWLNGAYDSRIIAPLRWLLDFAWRTDHRHFLQPSEVCDRSFIRHLNSINAGLEIPFWWPLLLSGLRLVKVLKGTPQFHVLGTAKAEAPVIATDLAAQIFQGISSVVIPITVLVPCEQTTVYLYKKVCPQPNYILASAGVLFVFHFVKARRAAPLQGFRKHVTTALTKLWWMVPTRLLHGYGDAMSPQINGAIVAGFKLLFKGGSIGSLLLCASSRLTGRGASSPSGAPVALDSMMEEISMNAQAANGGDSAIRMSLVAYGLSLGVQVWWDYIIRSKACVVSGKSVPHLTFEEAEFVMDPTSVTADKTALASEVEVKKVLEGVMESEEGRLVTAEEKKKFAMDALASKENDLKKKVAFRGAIISVVEDVVLSGMTLAILLRHRSYTKALGFRLFMSVIMYAVEYGACKRFAK